MKKSAKNKGTSEQLFAHIRNKKFASEEELTAYLETLKGKTIDSIIEVDDSKEIQVMKLLDKASTTRSEKTARKYISQALVIDPDAADAYLLLAAMEEDEPAYYQCVLEAEAAGKRAIGKEFKELKGHFWSASQTRPYMRALSEKADFFRALERDAEAIEVYEYMLELNPNDNQGIRHLLAPLLLALNETKKYKKLRKTFKEDNSLSFLLTDAFLANRTSPYSVEATQAFEEVFTENPFLGYFLMNMDEVEPQLPESYTLGSPEEAVFTIYTSAVLFRDQEEETMHFIFDCFEKVATEIGRKVAAAKGPKSKGNKGKPPGLHIVR
jgi:tetratricopeptide (TPR) repeat protein